MCDGARLESKVQESDEEAIPNSFHLMFQSKKKV